MTISAKKSIISFILKYNNQGVVKASSVANSLGMSRQLVTHHFNSLMRDGLLSKTGAYYKIENTDHLIDALLDADAGQRKIERPSRMPVFIKPNVLDLIDVLVAYRTLDQPYAHELKIELLEELKKAQGDLNQAKYYLLNKQFSPDRAEKIASDHGGAIYNRFKDFFESKGLSLDDFLGMLDNG